MLIPLFRLQKGWVRPHSRTTKHGGEYSVAGYWREDNSDIIQKNWKDIGLPSIKEMCADRKLTTIPLIEHPEKMKQAVKKWGTPYQRDKDFFMTIPTSDQGIRISLDLTDVEHWIFSHGIEEAERRVKRYDAFIETLKNPLEIWRKPVSKEGKDGRMFLSVFRDQNAKPYLCMVFVGFRNNKAHIHTAYFTSNISRGDSRRNGELIYSVAQSLSKGFSDARTKPFTSARHTGQRASAQLRTWGGDTHTAGPEDVYTLYRRLMGAEGRGEITVNTLKTDERGSILRVTDGKVTFRVYEPRNGPVRLLKGLHTYTPTANAVWTILRNAGYDGKPVDGVGHFAGCTITVKGADVHVEGPKAHRILRLLEREQKHKITTEAWVGGHQRLGQPSMTVRPW